MSGYWQTTWCSILAIGMLHGVYQMELNGARCGTGEWHCLSLHNGLKCINLNKVCDGIKNCPDGSDELPGCTNCNRTYSAKAGVKYPLRVTGPLQRYLPFVCRIHFVAMGDDFGDFVELSFLAFQVGRFEPKRGIASACRKGYMKLYESFPGTTPDTAEDSTSGNFCGRLMERSAAFYSKSSNLTLLILLPAIIHSAPPFSMFLTFKFHTKKLSNPTELNQFGNPIPGTFCDRIFLNCYFRPCFIRSPNFPGFYPRNVTCNYYVKQTLIPHANAAYVAIRQDENYKIFIPKGGQSSRSSSSADVVMHLLSTDCSAAGDAITVYDGSSPKMPILARLCGGGIMPDVVSSRPEMLVQLYSAPYNVLSRSRIEMSVSVHFEPDTSALMQKVAHSCSYVIDATRHMRWGIIKSPKHSMPENSICTYKFIGASSYERVWIYLISYISREKVSANNRTQDCLISELELYDTEDNWSLLEISEEMENYPLTFCGEKSTPKVCVHALDHPPHYSPPRPCKYPEESYLSTGPTFELRHKFFSTLKVANIANYGSFLARYEFIDTRQDGVAIGRTECDRRFDSRSVKGGFISNPKNVFLYGRGGRQNISCAFHFVGLPGERVRITLLRAKLKIHQEDATGCETGFDPVSKKYICHMPTEGKVKKMTFLKGVEYWDTHLSTIGCLCDISTTNKSTGYVFDSIVSNVKLVFAINFMTSSDDFNEFSFEAKFEFFNSTLCDTYVYEEGAELTPGGSLSFEVPPARTNFSNSISLPKPLRCRWEIKAATEKYIYLKTRGLISNKKDCDDGTWVMIYTNSNQRQPKTNICLVSSEETNWKIEEFQMFSSSWYNESDDVMEVEKDSILIEIVSVRYWEGIKLKFSWIEVTKPFFKSRSGRMLRNTDCIFECPDVGMCIDPHLWCDGIQHCPSGYDEALTNCNLFVLEFKYLSLVLIAGSVLVLVACFVVACTIIKNRTVVIVRRECEDNNDESEKDCEDCLTAMDDYTINNRSR